MAHSRRGSARSIVRVTMHLQYLGRRPALPGFYSIPHDDVVPHSFAKQRVGGVNPGAKARNKKEAPSRGRAATRDEVLLPAGMAGVLRSPAKGVLGNVSCGPRIPWRSAPQRSVAPAF